MTSALCYSQNRLTDKRFWGKFKEPKNRKDNFRSLLFLFISKTTEQRHSESAYLRSLRTARPQIRSCFAVDTTTRLTL